MARAPIPTWCFAVVVVRQGDRVLAVHEAQHGQLWYLPAGRVEPGETFADAARREALEETGVPVELEGVLRIEHAPYPDGARLRVIFMARPVDDRPPKAEPDAESLEARWVTLDELAQLPLRGPDLLPLFKWALHAPLMPLTLFGAEGRYA